jgi:hypothetical protein
VERESFRTAWAGRKSLLTLEKYSTEQQQPPKAHLTSNRLCGPQTVRK